VSFNPQSILVIDFGQLGDVVLSLPALRAIREKFPRVRITIAAGKATAPVIEMSGYADSILAVDRVQIRDGSKVLAPLRIARVVKEVRRANFDLVIDLHSLSETNLLGYASRATHRLYARRPGRSLDFLSNFRPAPPVEDYRPTKHQVDRYLDVLTPLGIRADEATRVPKLQTRAEDDSVIEQLLKKEKAHQTDAPLIGVFPGAGHPSRRWPLERFAELAERLVRNDSVRIALLAGPEEKSLVREMRERFPPRTIVFDQLTISQLASLLARLSVFVSNDTGPMHIATAVGTSVVALFNGAAPNSYVPLEARHRIIHSRQLVTEIETDEVYGAARALLTRDRTAALFAN